uniref:Uncharacterized protein n=1 Tax=Oryza barthii TaxID=65489 RepID=A0A0D3H4Y3_9ORYZ
MPPPPIEFLLVLSSSSPFALRHPRHPHLSSSTTRIFYVYFEHRRLVSKMPLSPL